MPGSSMTHRAVGQAFDDGGFDTRQRPAHRARLDVQRRGIGDHDAAGLGLPPVVVDRQAQHLLAPPHRFGIERLADAGNETQPGEVKAPRQFAAGFHQHADRRRRGVPDADALVLQDAVPALGVELGLVDDHRHAVQQRRNDAVGHAGHPARVSGAPEDVAGMQVERVQAGGVVREHRFVDVDRALRPPGGAAGEVQQRHLVGARGHAVEGIGGLVHQRAEVVRVRGHRNAAAVVDQQHLLERSDLRPHRRHLARVQRRCRQQRPRAAEVHARGNRLRAKGREQRRDHDPGLERAEHRGIQLRQTRREHEEAVAAHQAEARDRIRKAVGQAAQFVIADAPLGAFGAEPLQRHMRAAPLAHRAVERFEADVESAAGQAVQARPQGI